MDFINKLTHQEAEHEHLSTQKQEQPATVVVPPPMSSTSAPAGGGDTSPSSKRNFLEQLIAGTGGGHAHGSSHEDNDDTDDPSHLSFLDKLTRKHDREARLRALDQREAEVQLALAQVARDQKANEGFLERIKDHFDGDDDPSPSSSAAPPKEDENKEPSFLEKLTHPHAAEHEAKAAALAEQEARLRAELAQIARDRRDCQGVLARLQQHLARDEEDGTAQKAKDEDPSFFDKITGRAQAEAEERRRKEEECKSTLDKVKDRIEEGMGGGKKAEEKVDFLDKSTFLSPADTMD